MLLFVLLLPTVVAAEAPCGELAPLLDSGLQAAAGSQLEALRAQVMAARQVLPCGAPAAPRKIGTLRLLEGAVAALDGDEDAAREAFAAARRLVPELWVEGLGPELQAQYLAALPEPGQATLEVEPWPVAPTLFIDGSPAGPGERVARGLVLVQAGAPGQAVAYSQDHRVSGDWLRVETGLSPAAEVLSPLQAEAREDWARLRKRLTGASYDSARAALEEYIALYEGEATRQAVWIPELRKARASLQQTVQQIERDSGGYRRVQAEDDAPRWALGPVAILGGGWLGGGEPQQDGGPGALGGLGPTARLGVEWTPAGPLRLRVDGGYQSIIVDTSGQEETPQATRHHGWNAGAGVGASVGPVVLLAGPRLLGGGLQTSAPHDGYAVPVGWSGSLGAIGIAGSAGLDLVGLGPLGLELELHGGWVTDQDRSWTLAGLGLGLHPRS